MKTRTTRTGAAITPSEIRDLATPLSDDASLDPLLASIGDARFVLGKASHGTAEYCRWGAALTQRWIAEHDFSFVDAETGAAVGFYGLDVYSLWESLYAVFDYLQEHHPDAFEIARKAMRCFEPYGEDPQRYA